MGRGVGVVWLSVVKGLAGAVCVAGTFYGFRVGPMWLGVLSLVGVGALIFTVGQPPDMR